MYQQDSRCDWRLYSAFVEWKTIRAAYERAFLAAKNEGETQESIAERGGIRQNDLSRLFQNDRKGPRVETFVKAVKGLREGMTLADFFLQIERQTDGDLSARAIDSKTVSTPAESESRGGPGRPIPLDAAALLQAGNALVDAGGLFIAAAHGVEVKPRARTNHPARRRPTGQRRRASGDR